MNSAWVSTTEIVWNFCCDNYCMLLKFLSLLKDVSL